MSMRRDPDSPAVAREVLVVVVARIGDTLLATPAIAALRRAHPQARITVLAHPKRMDVLRHLDCIDRLAPITKRRAWWRGRCQPKRFDFALVYGNDAPLIRYAARVARRVAVFEQDGLPGVPGLVQVPRPGGTPIHAVSERLRLAEAMGAAGADLRLRYQVTPAERVVAMDWLVARFGPDFRPLVALQIASFPTKAHRDWPLESFAELMAQLLVHRPDAHFVVTGDAQARRRGRILHERFGPRVAIAAGKTTLRQSAALISCADLYVGVDTGPTHIAGAIGVPMVALYHNAYPGRYLAPLGHPRCIVIEHPMTGRSSSTDLTMADIPVAQVVAAARGVLDGSGGGA